MPGFGGDESLAGPRGHYVSSAAGAMSGQVVAAQSRRNECIPNCLCVTGENCPCCNSVPPEFVSLKARR